ncbi:MAG: hypothetical protein KIT54_08735 [Phycisphaeraceae bacterium]|nr:hypothetical protein [Phycisphaeraceae bacterium]
MPRFSGESPLGFSLVAHASISQATERNSPSCAERSHAAARRPISHRSSAFSPPCRHDPSACSTGPQRVYSSCLYGPVRELLSTEPWLLNGMVFDHASVRGRNAMSTASGATRHQPCTRATCHERLATAPTSTTHASIAHRHRRRVRPSARALAIRRPHSGQVTRPSSARAALRSYQHPGHRLRPRARSPTRAHASSPTPATPNAHAIARKIHGVMARVYRVGEEGIVSMGCEDRGEVVGRRDRVRARRRRALGAASAGRSRPRVAWTRPVVCRGRGRRKGRGLGSQGRWVGSGIVDRMEGEPPNSWQLVAIYDVLVPGVFESIAVWLLDLPVDRKIWVLVAEWIQMAPLLAAASLAASMHRWMDPRDRVKWWRKLPVEPYREVLLCSRRRAIAASLAVLAWSLPIVPMLAVERAAWTAPRAIAAYERSVEAGASFGHASDRWDEIAANPDRAYRRPASETSRSRVFSWWMLGASAVGAIAFQVFLWIGYAAYTPGAAAAQAHAAPTSGNSRRHPGRPGPQA